MAAKGLAERVNGWASEDLHKVVHPKEGLLASAPDQNFGVFFGRDAAISSMFLMDVYEKHPERADLLKPVRNSLVTMAIYQGKMVNQFNDEEPGRIIHEKREEDGYMDNEDGYRRNQEILDRLEANNWPVEGERGKRSMYAFPSIDSTPLFISTTSRYLSITKDVKLFKFLDPHIKMAIDWVENYGDTHGDGYVRYKAKNRHTLINQGWKDSRDSIEIAPGIKPVEPIALVEVQGYLFEAYLRAAQLYGQMGDAEYAKKLYQKAGVLKVKFNEDFWMPRDGTFAYALDGKNQQVAEIVSNTGHLLASGIVDSDKESLLVGRLMASDMLTAYGIRTLSVNSPNFSNIEPSAYHNGAIWPHDNALISRGMRIRGFVKEAQIVEDRILTAQDILATQYGRRDEELFTVDREGNLRPYETSQHPQGWVVTANLAITSA